MGFKILCFLLKFVRLRFHRKKLSASDSLGGGMIENRKLSQDTGIHNLLQDKVCLHVATHQDVEGHFPKGI